MLDNQKQISISIIHDGETVFDFLTRGLSLSKQAVKKVGFKKNYLTKKLKAREEIILPIELVNHNLINLEYSMPPIDILFEDEKLVVLSKPYNLHGHPLSYCENDNVLSFLRKKSSLFSLGKRSANKERGLLYRLDYVTSGVLIYIKDEKDSLLMRKNFKDRVISKEYICIVNGEFNREGQHTHFFEYKGEKSSKAVVSSNEEGVKANLEVKLMSYNKDKDLSLLKIRLNTGVRHQVRAQLAYLGFPLLGDTFYDGATANRVYLHAYRYEFILDGKTLSYRAKANDLFSDLFDCNSIL